MEGLSVAVPPIVFPEKFCTVKLLTVHVPEVQLALRRELEQTVTGAADTKPANIATTESIRKLFIR
jgi:hypothetical protein